MQRLLGKTALITGAARGIGHQFASAYLAEGAQVMIADINFGRAQEQADALGENAYAVALDVRNQESIENAVSETVRQLGRVDILINNAAIFSAAPIAEIERKGFDDVFSINVAGVLFMMQAVSKEMISNGKGGKIINMASQAGRRGEPLVAVYCASKAAVISLTQSVGLDLIQYGVNVNAIAPGVVDGEHWDGVDEYFAKYENKLPGQKKKEAGDAVPFGRIGVADDLTGMAIFLATDEANYIVGQTYNVDGGQCMN